VEHTVLAAWGSCQVCLDPTTQSLYCARHSTQAWDVIAALGGHAPCTDMLSLYPAQALAQVATEGNTAEMLQYAAQLMGQETPAAYEAQKADIVRHANCPPSLASRLLSQIPLRVVVSKKVNSPQVITQVLVPMICQKQLPAVAQKLVLYSLVPQPALDQLYEKNLVNLALYLGHSNLGQVLVHSRDLLELNDATAWKAALLRSEEVPVVTAHHLWHMARTSLPVSALALLVSSTSIPCTDETWLVAISVAKEDENIRKALVDRPNTSAHQLELLLEVYGSPVDAAEGALLLCKILQRARSGWIGEAAT